MVFWGPTTLTHTYSSEVGILHLSLLVSWIHDVVVFHGNLLEPQPKNVSESLRRMTATLPSRNGLGLSSAGRLRHAPIRQIGQIASG